MAREGEHNQPDQPVGSGERPRATYPWGRVWDSIRRGMREGYRHPGEEKRPQFDWADRPTIYARLKALGYLATGAAATWVIDRAEQIPETGKISAILAVITLLGATATARTERTASNGSGGQGTATTEAGEHSTDGSPTPTHDKPA